MRAIRKHLVDVAAIVGLIVIATAISYYILQKQRLRIPFVEETPFILQAELATAQAVTPGQGQTVRVSGVRIGDIAAVDLEDGRAIVTLEIDREYEKLIHEDATALLRPKTGLKDMFLEVDPGGDDGAPVAEENYRIPIQNTLPDVNPDEILSVLDEDTRDYLKLLLDGGGRGLHRRGNDLAEVFRRFEPTHRDLARVNTAVAQRRANLRRLISSLADLNEELAENDEDLSQLVTSSADVFAAFAAEEANVSGTVRELPSALRQTTETLGKVQAFAEVLRPTADALRPAARELDDANAAITPFARAVTPIIRDEIRPFVTAARPLVRDLRPAAEDLDAAAADVGTDVAILNRFFNMLAFNPNGRESPAKADRQEGYLFHLAWLAHQGVHLFSSSDAHGVFRPLTLGQPCNVIRQTVAEEPELAALRGITALLTPEVCNIPLPSTGLRAKRREQVERGNASEERKAAKLRALTPAQRAEAEARVAAALAAKWGGE